jgi:hypothetical protein
MRQPVTLRALQAAFAQAMIDGDHVPEAGVFQERGLSARQRLNVYYHHTRIAEGEALEAIYPAVCRLVGDEFFANMAILYARQYPLCQGDLRTLGGHLGDFMAQFPPLRALPYIADVARLEWACHESLHAAQASRDLPTSTAATLGLAPHVRLLHSSFPVATIWDFALREHTRETPPLNTSELGQEYVLVMRPGLDVEVQTLSEEDWLSLARFVGRGSVGGAGHDEGERRKHGWLARGILSVVDEAENTLPGRQGREPM